MHKPQKINEINEESFFPDDHSDAINALQKESLSNTFKNKSNKDSAKENPLQTQDSSFSKR